ATGRPLPDAVITVEREPAGRRVILRSTQDGRYLAAFLDAGRYTAVFERLGYMPTRVEGVVVGPGERVELPIALRPATGGGGQDVRRASAALSTFGPAAPQHWAAAPGAPALPLEGGGLLALAKLSSRFDADLGADGLPGSMTQVLIDGVPAMPRASRLARHARDMAFPIASLGGARTLPVVQDAEWPGSAGGSLMGLTRGGG